VINLKKLGSTKIQKPAKYPDKTSVNLLAKEKDYSDPKFQIIIFVIFLIILAVFVKFMVIDLIIDANAAQSKYESMQSNIATLQENNKDYSKIRAEYSHYGNGYLNDEEKKECDRGDMLDIIDGEVLSKADIQSVEISGNVAKITIDSVRLKTVSGIVSSLEENDAVSYVTVSTAGSSDSSSSVTATLAITFKSAGGDK